VVDPRTPRGLKASARPTAEPMWQAEDETDEKIDGGTMKPNALTVLAFKA
jgi:hypothetical protein